MSIVLIQLNEINFDIVKKYSDIGYSFKFLEEIYNKSIYTIEEEDYENLEPWIQWTTFFRGKPYKKHKVFRLGDGYKCKENNIFLDLQNLKKSCGAICPMNLSSKGINFDFFIPDPWSNENPIGSFRLKLLYNAIKFGVNNNSSENNNLFMKFRLLLGITFNLNPFDLKKLLKFYTGIKKYSFRKALFLDYLLVILHQKLIKKKGTQFSSIFLNAGAHIQHHYFLNSKVIHEGTNPLWYMHEDKDPLLEALNLYDSLIYSYKKLGYKIILMTGLRQIPTNRSEFYYRLDNHSSFLKNLGLNFKEVNPRMTRDFEILFESNKDRDIANKKLSQIVDENQILLFGEIEDREKSLFCSLTYDKEITKNKKFSTDNKFIKISKWVNFVAIKNGIHDSRGYLYIDGNNLKKNYGNIVNLSETKNLILREIESFFIKKD